MDPLIGISTYRERAQWGVWDTRADLIPSAYTDAIRLAGGIPVLLPPVEQPGQAAHDVLPRLDGLLIAGGADLDPGKYGDAPGVHTAGWRPDRDAWELALLNAAEERDIAVLGICRGMQAMTVHAGGTLTQHLPDLTGHDQHSPGGDTYGTITVDTVTGSRLFDLIGGQIRVECHHHQAVATHPGLIPVAHASDGTVEALDRAERDFWLGVQWHPEVTPDDGLFAGFVRAAGQHRAVQPVANAPR